MEVALSDVDDSSPATSEVIHDSESGSQYSALSFAAADDEDDAESCSGGGGEGCRSDDEDVRDCGRIEQCRWMSWRSWLMERPAMEQGEVGEHQDSAAAEEDEMAAEEVDQSNRRFWETCLAHGY